MLGLQQGDAPRLTCSIEDGAVVCCAEQFSGQNPQEETQRVFGMQCVTPNGTSVELTASGQVRIRTLFM